MSSVSSKRASGQSGNEPPQSSPGAPELVFIVQNKPEKFSKQTSTQIRKHVMKDIGKSRRKDRRNRQVSLELPESIEEASSGSGSMLPFRPSTGQPGTFQNFVFDDDGLDSLENAEVVSCTSFNLQDYALEFQPSGSQHVAPEYLQQSYQGCAYDIRDSRVVAQSPSNIERPGSGQGELSGRCPVPLKGQIREMLDEGSWRDACLSVGTLGPAAFHQMLSNALLNIRFRQPTCTPSDGCESMERHIMAVKIIKEAMSDQVVATSDAFIGAIVGLTCYHCHSGNHDAWKIHMNGLEQVVRLRGGIHTLDSNKRVRTLLGWSDITGSSVEDLPPRFPLPPFIPDIDTLQPCPTISTNQEHIVTLWLLRFTSHISLLNLMNQLQNVNYHLQQEAQNPDRKIFDDGDFATAYLFPLIHQCLSLSGNILADEHDANILQSVRISCLLYTAEVRRRFGIDSVVARLPIHNLRFYLQNSTHDWGDLGMLRLWCLAIGGMESEGADRAWFAAEVAREGAELGYPMWHDLETKMEEMIWFTDAHRPKFWSLYHGFDDSLPGSECSGVGEAQNQYPEPSGPEHFGGHTYSNIGW
ncbi:hypothetical protein ONS96_007131 [Cadophora gregata f. sp. sojae]|nr:hypothetical protein ONS96_007131 [Cadophora gregata f. sp. sojae]